MNLPNTLTLARIFLVPLLVVVLLTNIGVRELLGVPTEVVAAGIFALASLTDWLDGYLARRRGQVTALGQLMDPLADKLLVTAALVSLVQMGLVPAWMAAIIIGREIAVTALRSYAQTRGVTMPALPLGKLKMAMQVAAILLLLLGREQIPQLFALGQLALWIVLLLATVSAVDYYRRYVGQVSDLGPKPADYPAAESVVTKKAGGG